MAYLARVYELPSPDSLTEADRRTLDKRFDANAYELNFDGQPVDWTMIEEIEIVVAARQSTPAGWLLKKVVFAGDRYHIGVYFGKNEIVLTNLTLEAARFVAATIAHFAPSGVRYAGIPDFVATTEG